MLVMADIRPQYPTQSKFVGDRLGFPISKRLTLFGVEATTDRAGLVYEIRSPFQLTQ